MTRPNPHPTHLEAVAHAAASYVQGGTMDALEVKRVVPVPVDDFPCCRRPRRTREQWRFLGRELHWGYEFLVWTLEANPSGRRKVGQRFARWVQL